jgi:Uma2 family endonuclease
MVVANVTPEPIVYRGRRYLRAPVPIFFPVDEPVPEGRWHRLATEALAQSVEEAFARQVLVSSDQFLYWDPTDPKRCLAPDVAIRLGAPSELVQSWKIWERGAPQVGVEVTSDSDAPELKLEEKLERYRQAGVAEVVRYDRHDRERPIRLWDLLDGDLVERDLADPEALRCTALGWYWFEYDDPELGVSLRLSRDRAGKDLVSTPREAALRATEAALARVAELEAELKARG